MRSCSPTGWPTTRGASRSITAPTPGAPKPSSNSLQPTMPVVGGELDEVVVAPARIAGQRLDRLTFIAFLPCLRTDYHATADTREADVIPAERIAQRASSPNLHVSSLLDSRRRAPRTRE